MNKPTRIIIICIMTIIGILISLSSALALNSTTTKIYEANTTQTTAGYGSFGIINTTNLIFSNFVASGTGTSTVILNQVDNNGTSLLNTTLTGIGNLFSARGIFLVDNNYYITSTSSSPSQRGVYKFDTSGNQQASYLSNNQAPSFMVYDSSQNYFYIAVPNGDANIKIVELDTNLTEVSSKNASSYTGTPSYQGMTKLTNGLLLIKYTVGTTNPIAVRIGVFNYSSGTLVCEKELWNVTRLTPPPTAISAGFGGFPNGIPHQGQPIFLPTTDGKYLLTRGDITNNLTGYLSEFDSNTCTYTDIQENLLFAKSANGLVKVGEKIYYIFSDSYLYGTDYPNGGATSTGTGVYLTECNAVTGCNFSNNNTIYSSNILNFTFGREIHSGTIGDNTIITWVAQLGTQINTSAFKTTLIPDPIPCTPNYYCAYFQSCNASNILPCTNVSDLNNCSIPYNPSNYSDYDQSCTYTPPTPTINQTNYTEQDLPLVVVDGWVNFAKGFFANAMFLALAIVLTILTFVVGTKLPIDMKRKR